MTKDQVEKQTTAPESKNAEDANKRSKRDVPVKVCLPDGCCGICSPYTKGQFTTV